MTAAILLSALIVGLALLALAVVLRAREPSRRIRRREYAAAVTALNDIDQLVDDKYVHLDLVGQQVANEIRTLIRTHRKELKK